MNAYKVYYILKLNLVFYLFNIYYIYQEKFHLNFNKFNNLLYYTWLYIFYIKTRKYPLECVQTLF